MDDKTYSLSYVVTKKDISEFVNSNPTSIFSKCVGISAIIMSIGFAVFSLITSLDSIIIADIALLALGVISLFINEIIVCVGFKNLEKRYGKSFSRNIELTDKIYLFTNMDRSVFEYSQVKKIIETKNNYVIKFNSRLGTYLPKSAVSDENQEAISQLSQRTNVPVKKKSNAGLIVTIVINVLLAIAMAGLCVAGGMLLADVNTEKYIESRQTNYYTVELTDVKLNNSVNRECFSTCEYLTNDYFVYTAEYKPTKADELNGYTDCATVVMVYNLKTGYVQRIADTYSYVEDLFVINDKLYYTAEEKFYTNNDTVTMRFVYEFDAKTETKIKIRVPNMEYDDISSCVCGNTLYLAVKYDDKVIVYTYSNGELTEAFQTQIDNNGYVQFVGDGKQGYLMLVSVVDDREQAVAYELADNGINQTAIIAQNGTTELTDKFDTNSYDIRKFGDYRIYSSIKKENYQSEFSVVEYSIVVDGKTYKLAEAGVYGAISRMW